MARAFDHRADTFCLVTSDSDFSYLCRKLRERGATVFIVGEPKTPDALRNACDQRMSAAALTMLIGLSVISTSIGASGAVITISDDDPMCTQTTVPSSAHAARNGSQ